MANNKVSESEDTGTARARADAKSIAQGEKDFGPNNSLIRNAVGTRSLEDRNIGPFIQIYPNKYAKGGAVSRFKDDHAGHYDMKRGGSVRGSCCAVRGKTKGRMV